MTTPETKPPAAAHAPGSPAYPTSQLPAPSRAPDPRLVSQDKAKDPVCGMDVFQEEAVTYGRTSAADGKTYYFCSEQCKRTFDKQRAGAK